MLPVSYVLSFSKATQLLTVAAIFLAMTFDAQSVQAKKVDVWFGTTTPKNGTSKGIYHASFETETGKLSAPELAAEINNPGFLALHPSGKVLYATGGRTPSITAFGISGKAGNAKLTLMNSVETGDGGAAHVSVDRTGKVVLSAQYGGGSTGVYAVADDGSLKSQTQLLKHEGGSGVVERRQDASHAHWSGTAPDNRFAFVPDLGLDKVVIWKLNADEAKLTPHGFGVCPPGGGPRHMKFHPNGKQIYVLNELALSITTFNYDAEAGTMTPIQTIETLSEAVKAKESFNSASEIRVHSSGKFVYSANRGNDTISVFRVDEATGTLTFVETEAIRGGWPRNFNIDPSGKWLIAAGRDTHTATVFAIDQSTGELTYDRSLATVPSPICVVFGE